MQRSEINRTVSWGTPLTLVSMVDEHLRLSPERTVLNGNQSVKARDLLDRSCALTSALKDTGATAGSIVAIDTSSMVGFIVALLATMRLGAAYIAVDTKNPDIGVSALKYSEPIAFVAEHLPAWANGYGIFVALNQPSPDLTVSQQLDRDRNTAGDRPYQLALTSGSTGNPKYVVTSYGAVENRVRWFLERYPLFPSDCVAVHKDPSIVGSPVEILTGLCSGASITILDRQTLLDPDDLWAMLCLYGVTHIFGSPPILELVLDSAVDQSENGLLKLVASSALPLKWTLASTWLKRFPDTLLLNMYGLSETCSNVTCYEVVTEPSVAHAQKRLTVPLGNTINGCDIRLMSDVRKQAVFGEPGEIHLSGVCLALGYWKHSELTDRKFFVDQNGVRWFATGDHGLLDPADGLVILGRKDGQIKVRGYKVIPEELEAFVSSADGNILACAVAAIGDSADAEGVIALVTSGHHIDISALWEKITEGLPAHMRPSNILQIEKIPTTKSGKINRAAVAQILQAHILDRIDSVKVVQ